MSFQEYLDQCQKILAAHEDVLAVYQRAYTPNRPVICLDEIQKALRSIWLNVSYPSYADKACERGFQILKPYAKRQPLGKQTAIKDKLELTGSSRQMMLVSS